MKLHQFIKPLILTLCIALSNYLNAQYTGGEASGTALGITIQSVCSPLVYPDIYKGGEQDGFDAVAVVQANCSPLVMPAIFTGGNDDGHAMLELNQVNCSPVIYPNIFAGGIEDGYATSGLTQASCQPHIYPAIFAGGVEDGYAAFNLNQTNCNPDPLPDIYSGGIEDGHAMVAMFTACAPFADFTADFTVVCEGDTVNFTDLSLGIPTSWSWTFNGGNPANSSQQNPSVVYDTPGTYSVTLFITSGTGNSTITKTDYIIVNAVPVPLISASGPTSFCEGDSVLISCAPAFNLYNWSNGANTQNTFAFASGTYSVTVTSANGCSGVSNPIDITVLGNPNGPTPVCAGDTVMLTSSPANSYNWSPGGQSSQNIAVTSSGTFWVSATYANGCSRISDPVSVSFGITPAKPVITPSGPLNFCDGGSVTLQSSPAPGYLWSPGGQTSQSVIISNSGTYYVEAVGASGCTNVSDPVTVTVLPQTPVPTISANGPTTFCDGGSVELTSSAATSYLWSPGGQTTQSIIVTTSGTYTVQADNGTGCTAESLPITVTVNAQTPVPTISANGPTTFCDGGSVELTSSAATSYLWSPGGQTTQSIIVNTSGTYTVQADNGTGCTAESLPINVTVNSVPAVPVITASGPLTFCDGDSVVLTSSVSGSYLWHPSGAVTQSITVNSAGTHYVEVFNGSCSSVSLPVTVSILPNPGVPTITPNGLTELCAGDSVLLSSSPATSYLWYPGSETTQNIWVSSSGTYWVEVFNPSGCSSISQEISVTVHPNPVVTIVGDLIVCEGTTETYTVSNQPGLDYFWTVNGATITGGIGTHSIDVMFDDEGNIQIEVTVVDQVTGCSASEMISVSSLSAPVAYAGPDLSICYGDTVQLQAYGGTTYLWIPSFGLSNPNIADPLAFPTVTTQYIVEVANGSCTDRDTMLLTVNPLPIADAGSDAYIMLGECATLSGSGGLYYFWSPGTGLSSQTTATPQACPEETTNYVLLVTDLNGCTSTDEMTVFVTQYTGEISFPNTFTPNGDGINDKWEIDGLEAYPDHNLIIFNRWGNKVYDAQPYLNDWEGDCIGKPLPDGTYYFVFDPGDGSEPVKSYLTIIR